ncbi:MAG TPA: adenylate/guanylate cyclase domain-containing protein [Longimicrobiales bacterium]|nr:adenylate/guanylate cyclase domain-containing protein [Longimicrobiales bacterium]
MVRQLTAIMFTDMAGYTALMQHDERRAKLERDRQRSVLEAAVERHGGRVLQYFGDGTLSVFVSAIAAVRCAIQIQEELRADPPIRLRIGVHTGDVVHDEDGVFGDGVNLAARLEAMCAPGGILISGKVFDEVKNHPEIETRGLGAYQLKNVQHPMQVFAVTNGGLAVPSEAELAAQRARRRRSVAVLPFLNMSTDPDNEFFSDGITEEIINALTRVNGLKVTARTSSFAFKGRNEDVRAIARQLAVTHVVEGSVRRAGQRIRVTAQLVSARDGYHVFSETYDRKIEDIFAVQDDIARAIVERLAHHLAPVPTSQEAKEAAAHTHDTEGYAEYLKGRYEWARYSPESSRRAIRHYERSIRLDGGCALPFTGLAYAYVFLGATGHMSPADAFPRAEEAALKALELEPDAGMSHVALGAVKLFHHWDFDGAYRSFQKALSLTPGSADAHYLYSMYLRVVGEIDEAIEEARTAVQLDPLSPTYNDSLAAFLATAGRLEEATEQVERALEIDPNFRSAIETLGWIRALEGDIEGALAQFEQLPILAGYEAASAANRGWAYVQLGRRNDALRMLALLEERAAQNPDLSVEMDLAVIHEALGNRDESLACLNRAVDRRVGGMVLIDTWVTFGEVRQDPRFQSILDRIGLPRTAAAV